MPSIYNVGSGQTYATFAALPTLVPGDTVNVAAGTHNEAVKWTASGTAIAPITIQGVGPTMPIIDGTGVSVTGSGSIPRALFQIEGGYYVIANLEFRNATNPAFNGAGIRVTNGGSNTTIKNCLIDNNDMGMMSDSNDNLLVDHCEFNHNGNVGFDGKAHNFYLAGNRSTIQFCYIHDAFTGQNVKSRGHYTALLYNLITNSNEGEVGLVEGPDTTTPGSDALLQGNIIISKSNRTGNTGKFVDFGQDLGTGGTHVGVMTLINNTMIAGSSSINFLGVSEATSSMVANKNVFSGSTHLAGTLTGPLTGTANWATTGATIPSGFSGTVTGAAPGFVNAGAADYRLTPASTVRAAGQGALSPGEVLTTGWATFGKVLPPGVATTGLQLGILSTQTDIKTTWPDGSIRFAIVTAKVPTAIGNGTFFLASGPASSGTFTPTIPTASVTLTIGGVVWTATLPASKSGDLWLDGPLVSEWRSIVAPLNPSLVAHVFLRVVFDTRVYSDGSARVDVAVENDYDIATADQVTYNVAIVVAGSTVFTQAAVTHGYLCRWRKVFGVNLTASTATTRDFSTYYAAGAVPACLPGVTNATYSTAGATFAILMRGGNGSDYMPTTGGREEIAPYPDWAARYLFFQDPTLLAYTTANGDLAGSWPIHVRNSDSSLPTINKRPYFGVDPSRTDKPAGNLSNTGPLTPDSAHVPSLAYIPYIITGDRYYIEESCFWANYALFFTYPNPVSQGGRGYSRGIIGTEQVRARAWGLRNLADSAAYLPDSHPIKPDFVQLVKNNLNYFDSYAAAHVTPLGTSMESSGINGPNFVNIAQWQNNFLAWAIGNTNHHGFLAGQGLRDQICRFDLKLFNSDPDFPRTYAGPYWPNVGTATGGTNFVFYTTMLQLFQANYTAGVPTDTQLDGYYGIDARLSLLTAVFRGWTNAQSSYDWLMTQIPNDSTIRPGWDILTMADPAYIAGLPAATGPFSFWGGLPKPTGFFNDGIQMEAGLKFKSDVPGQITGVSFYKNAGETGGDIAHVWTAGGTLLATAPFTTQTSSGWQSVTLGTPVPIVANTPYVVSRYSPSNFYSADTLYFASDYGPVGFDAPPLRAVDPGGLYHQAAGGGFPASTSQNTNYWVDVAFSPIMPTYSQLYTVQDPTFAATPDWSFFQSSNADEYHTNTTTGVASWTLPYPSGSFRVSIWWFDFSNRTTKAVYTVLDGTTVLSTLTINQLQTPAAAAVSLGKTTVTDANGKVFLDLGTFNPTSGSLVVKASKDVSDPSGATFVIIDTLRTESPVPFPPRLEPARIDKAYISPSGKSLAFLITDFHGTATTVSSIVTAPTISVNGGSAITLLNPIWETDRTYILYPLTGTKGVLGSPVAPTDTLTVTAVDSWAMTPIGAVGALAAVAATHQNSTLVKPFVFNQKTMKVGYNTSAIDYYSPVPIYANLARSGSGAWTNNVILDANGNLINVTSGGQANTFINIPSPYFRGPSGTYTILYHSTSNTYSVFLSSPNGEVGGPTVTPLGGGFFKVQHTVTVAAGGGPTLWLNFSSGSGSFAVDATQIAIYDSSIDIANPPLFHPQFARMITSKCIRAMDALRTNGSSVIDFTDFADNLQFSLTEGRKDHYSISSLGPYSNSDAFFNNTAGCLVLITFTAPHGIKEGQTGVFKNVGGGPNGDGTIPMTSGGPATPTFFSSHLHLVSSTSVAFDLYTGINNQVVAGTNTYTGTIDVNTRFGMPVADCVALCNQVGADLWFNVPHAATDACTTTTMQYIAANLNAGLKCHVEYSNETWNGQFIESNYTKSMSGAIAVGSGLTLSYAKDGAGHVVPTITSGGSNYVTGIPITFTGGTLISGVAASGWLQRSVLVPGGAVTGIYLANPGNYSVAPTGFTLAQTAFTDGGDSWYAMRISQHWANAAVQFAAAGRPATDMVRTMGSVAAAPGSTTARVAYAVAHGVPIDEVAIAPYFHNKPEDGAFGAIYDALDADQLMDVGDLSMSYTDDGNSGAVSGHQATVVNAGSSAKIVCYEGGPEYGGLQTAVAGIPGQTLRAVRSRAWVRHPRMYWIMLDYLQKLQDAGSKLFNDFNIQGQVDHWLFGGDAVWPCYTRWNQPASLGDGSDGLFDNRTNLEDLANIGSVVGKAINTWNGLLVSQGPTYDFRETWPDSGGASVFGITPQAGVVWPASSDVTNVSQGPPVANVLETGDGFVYAPVRSVISDTSSPANAASIRIQFALRCKTVTTTAHVAGVMFGTKPGVESNFLVYGNGPAFGGSDRFITRDPTNSYSWGAAGVGVLASGQTVLCRVDITNDGSVESRVYSFSSDNGTTWIVIKSYSNIAIQTYTGELVGLFIEAPPPSPATAGYQVGEIKVAPINSSLWTAVVAAPIKRRKLGRQRSLMRGR